MFAMIFASKYCKGFLANRGPFLQEINVSRLGTGNQCFQVKVYRKSMFPGYDLVDFCDISLQEISVSRLCFGGFLGYNVVVVLIVS